MGEVFKQTTNYVNPNEEEIELWSLTVEDGLTSKTERYNREFLIKKDNNFKEVRPGEIVYNPMNMTLGAVGYNGMAKSVAVSGYYTTMNAKNGHDSYYINTWLKSPQAISLYKTFATGSLIEKQRVQFPTLSIIPATFPSYEEQVKIGEYFLKLDTLITLHQWKYNINDKDEVSAWEQRKFGDLGSVAMCKRIFKDQTSSEGDIPFYKIGTFGANPDAFISRELFEEYKEKFQYPRVGDMLISASGTIGRTVEYKGEEAYFQDSNIVWFKHDESIDNSFLKCIYGIVKWSGIEGSTIKRLYNDNFLKTEFFLPELEEQKKIGTYFQSLDTLITLHQQKLETLQNIKKFMLGRMFV